jgi:hypothetical protein
MTSAVPPVSPLVRGIIFGLIASPLWGALVYLGERAYPSDGWPTFAFVGGLIVGAFAGIRGAVGGRW